MQNHAHKSCPRCDQPFNCKPGNITQCHCYGLKINNELSAHLEQRYNDCLCHACLQYLQQETNLFREKYFRDRNK